MSVKEFSDSIRDFSQCLEVLPLGHSGTPKQNRAVQSAAKKVMAFDPTKAYVDLSQLSEGELQVFISLAAKISDLFENIDIGGGFNRRLFSSKTREKTRLSCRVLLSQSTRCQCELLERNKRSTLQLWRDLYQVRSNNGQLSEYYKMLNALWDLSKRFFSDRNFAFFVLQALAEAHPLFLCLVLKDEKFPNLEKNEILQVGAFLQEPPHRESFSAHFDIDSSELARVCQERVKTRATQDQRVGDGICLGLTVSRISSAVSKRRDLFPCARFIQASHDIVRKVSNTIDIGQTILADSNHYPFVLAHISRLMGFENVEFLLAAYAVDHSFAIAKLVGGIACLKIQDINCLLQEVAKAARDAFEDLEKWANLANSEYLDGATKSFAAIASEMYRKQTEILLTQSKALTSELEKLVALLKQKQSVGIQEDVPRAVLRRLKLKEKPPLYEKIPIEELSSHLKSLPIGKESFKLILHRKEANENGHFIDHAIYISVCPLLFCDPNDYNPITGIPRLREGFKTIDEMVDLLQQVLAFTYPKDRWISFSLTPYENISSNSR